MADKEIKGHRRVIQMIFYHDSNGEIRQAGAERLPVLREWTKMRNDQGPRIRNVLDLHDIYTNSDYRNS